MLAKLGQLESQLEKKVQDLASEVGKLDGDVATTLANLMTTTQGIEAREMETNQTLAWLKTKVLEQEKALALVQPVTAT